MNTLLILTFISSMVFLNYVTDCCTINDWACRNGSCVPMRQRCDSSPDCADGSDEVNCTGKVCLEGLILCQHRNGSQFCIRVGTACDSVSTTDSGITLPTGKIFSTMIYTVHASDTTTGVVETRSGLSTGEIAGIIIGTIACIAIAAVLIFVIKRECKGICYTYVCRRQCIYAPPRYEEYAFRYLWPLACGHEAVSMGVKACCVTWGRY